MSGEPAVARRSGAGWKLALRLVVERGVPRRARQPRARPRRQHPVPPPAPHGAPARSRPCSRCSSASCCRPGAGSRCCVVFDAPVPLQTLTGHYLAGQFVGNVLPSTIGGDVLRVTRCAKTVGSTTTAFASVVLERLSGMIALPLLVVVGFVLRPSLFHVAHAWVALFTAGDHARRARRSSCSRPAIPGSAAASPATRTGPGSSARCSRASTGPGASRARCCACSATALVYQLSIVLSYLLIFHALDRSVPIAADDRVHSRGVDAPGAADLVQRPGRARERARAVPPRLRRQRGRGRRRRPALVRIARRRQHARRADRRGRPTRHARPSASTRADRSSARDGDGDATASSRAAAGSATAASSTGGSRSSRSSRSTSCTRRSGTRTAAIRLHAFDDARHIISIEHHLGIFHEATIQRWALHFKPLIITANYFYGSLHFIVTIGVAVWLFRSYSDDYPRFRNTLADHDRRSRSSASRCSR